MNSLRGNQSWNASAINSISLDESYDDLSFATASNKYSNELLEEELNKPSNVVKTVRRSSVQDRTNQILDRNKTVRKLDHAESDKTDRLKSYESTLADLMEGISFPMVSDKRTTDSCEQLSVIDQNLISPGDSFEISATDLEVGTHALRRAKEKATDRRARRQSLDQAPHTSPRREIRTKNSSSPEVKFKGATQNASNQASVALSSIHSIHNFNSNDNSNGNLARYGSLERSDGDIYNMLLAAHTDNNDIVNKKDKIESSHGEHLLNESVDGDELNAPSVWDSGLGHLDRSPGKGDECDYSLDDFEEHDQVASVHDTTSKKTEPPLKSAVPVAALSHVDEIMQRWYNKDSDFLKMSMETSYFGNHETNQESIQGNVTIIESIQPTPLFVPVVEILDSTDKSVDGDAVCDALSSTVEVVSQLNTVTTQKKVDLYLEADSTVLPVEETLSRAGTVSEQSSPAADSTNTKFETMVFIPSPKDVKIPLSPPERLFVEVNDHSGGDPNFFPDHDQNWIGSLGSTRDSNVNVSQRPQNVFDSMKRFDDSQKAKGFNAQDYNLYDAVHVNHATAALKKRLATGTVRKNKVGHYGSVGNSRSVGLPSANSVERYSRQLIGKKDISRSNITERKSLKNSTASAVDIFNKESESLASESDPRGVANFGLGREKVPANSIAWETLQLEYETLFDERQKVRDREGAVSLRELLQDNKQSIDKNDVVHTRLTDAVSKQMQELTDLRISERDYKEEIIRLKAILNNFQGRDLNTGLKTNILANILDNEVGTDIISVNRLYYESLLHDHTDQEALIVGFQKENERLTDVLKNREFIELTKQAAFYDQLEVLNKELNRLRNGNCERDHINAAKSSFVGLTHGSVDQLRTDLELDIMVRSLKERVAIAENEAKDRERVFVTEKEKLITENRALTEINNALMLNKNTLIRNATEKQNSVVSQLVNENARLSKKINWYVENQVFVDGIAAENSALRTSCSALEQELTKWKFSHADITNEISFTGGDQLSRIAYMKKNKELESVIQDLQKTIRNRKPNSVVSLVHAAASSQPKYNQQELIIDRLRSELENTRVQHAAKYRGLRQEYDRLKSHGDFSTRQVNNEEIANHSVHSISDLAKVSELNEKIKCLEEEMSRLRGFYAKKIEDLQHKYESQIRALKRGTPSAGKGSEDSADTTSISSNKMNIFYSERIARLEDDLMKTSKELGQMKAEKEAKHCLAVEQIEKNKVTEDIPTSKEQDNELETQKQINEVQIQQMQHAHKSESDRLTQHWTLERNQLLKQLHSAEMRSFALEQAEEFTESFLPRNNVENLEFQLKALEQRLHGREIEFVRAIEKSQEAYFQERMKLVSGHQQELHEKDLQLHQIRKELNNILETLYRLQSTSGSSELS